MGEKIVANRSSLGRPGGGYIPTVGGRACRWARALFPLKATSQPDWARSQFSTSDWSHWEVSAGGEAGVVRSDRPEGLRVGSGEGTGRGVRGVWFGRSPAEWDRNSEAQLWGCHLGTSQGLLVTEEPSGLSSKGVFGLACRKQRTGSGEHTQTGV